MSIENNNSAFFANLYLDGIPLVLNQQRLTLRLRDPRITRRERLEVEAELAYKDGADYLTLADHEDDKPLLLKFAVRGGMYDISVAQEGTYKGSYLRIKPDSKQLYAGDDWDIFGFIVRKYGVANAAFSDLEAGPAYIQMVNSATGWSLYRDRENGKVYFLFKDPNKTGHDAFNNEPANFIIKVAGMLGE